MNVVCFTLRLVTKDPIVHDMKIKGASNEPEGGRMRVHTLLSPPGVISKEFVSFILGGFLLWSPIQGLSALSVA